MSAPGYYTGSSNLVDSPENAKPEKFQVLGKWRARRSDSDRLPSHPSDAPGGRFELLPQPVGNDVHQETDSPGITRELLLKDVANPRK